MSAEHPLLQAVRAALSDMEGHDYPPNMDSEMIESAAEIIANAGRYDPETKVDEKLLVRSVLIAFHVGFCAAQAKRDAADLASIVRID